MHVIVMFEAEYDVYVDGSWSDGKMLLGHNNDLNGKVNEKATFCN